MKIRIRKEVFLFTIILIFSCLARNDYQSSPMNSGEQMLNSRANLRVTPRDDAAGFGERNLVSRYNLLLDSFFIKMKDLLFVPISQFQELYLGYFYILQQQNVIDRIVVDNLYAVLMNFINDNIFLYDLPSIPQNFIKKQLNKALVRENFGEPRNQDTSEFFFQNKANLRQWVDTANPDINNFIKSSKLSYIIKNGEFLNFVLNGLLSYLQNLKHKKEQFELPAILKEYFDRLQFLKITTNKLDLFLKAQIEVFLQASSTDEENVLEKISELADHFKDSQQRKEWLEVQKSVEHEFWSVASSNEDKLVNFIDSKIISNPRIVDPQFRTYYILKLQNLISRMTPDDRSKLLSNPQILFQLFKLDFFPEFNIDRSLLIAFQLFGKSFAIDSSSMLTKTFNAYSYELVHSGLIQTDKSRKLTQMFKDLSSGAPSENNNSLKSSKENFDKSYGQFDQYSDSSKSNAGNANKSYNENWLSQFAKNLNGSSIYNGFSSIKHERRLETSLIQYVSSIIGMNNYLIHQSRWTGRLFWKRYHEFYNLRKPGAIAFHLHTLARIIRPYSKIRGFYKLKTILSHYADNLKAINILRAKEKKIFIRVMISVILHGYMRMGKFNFRLAFKRYKDHVLGDLVAAKPTILQSKTQLTLLDNNGKASNSLNKRQSSNLFFERIMDYKIAQKKALKYSLHSFLKSNYKFRKNLNHAVDQIVERIRDHDIKKLPEVSENLNARLWHGLSSNLISSKSTVNAVAPIIERSIEYKNLKKPYFGLTLIECFRQNFNNIKFSSWASLQKALRKYIYEIEGLTLQPQEINMLKQAFAGLKPFYSYGNINYAKFLAGYPEKVEVISNLSNRRSTIVDAMKALNLPFDKVFPFWSRFIEMAASFYDDEDFNLIKEFVGKYYLCSEKAKQLWKPSSNELFSDIASLLQSSESVECGELIDGDKKKVLIDFYLRVPLDSIVQSKQILAAARRIHAYQTEYLANVYQGNRNVFLDLLGEDVFSQIDRMLQEYTNISATQKLSLYRKSDHALLIEELSKVFGNNRTVLMLINMFNRYAGNLLVIEPITSAQLNSSLRSDMQFCSHSTKNLNILFESIKINEKIGEKKSILQFVRKHILNEVKPTFKSKDMFNIYKIMYHMKLSKVQPIAEVIKSFQELISVMNKAHTFDTIKKGLFKWIKSDQLMSGLLRKEQLLGIIRGDHFNNYSMPTIRKRMFKLFDDQIKKLSIVAQPSPKSSKDTAISTDAIMRVHYLKHLQQDVLQKFVGFSYPKNNPSTETQDDNKKIIAKYAFKFIAAIKNQVLKFSQDAKEMHQFLTETFGPVMRKQLIKYIGAIQKIKLNLAQEGNEMLQNETDLSPNDFAVHKFLLKNIPIMKTIRLSTIKRMKELLARHEESQNLLLKKQFLKTIDTFLKIRYIAMKIFNESSSKETEDSNKFILKKQLLKTLSSLKNLKLSFHKYLNPQVSQLFDDSEASPFSVVKRLYKLMSNIQVQKAVLNRNKISLEVFEQLKDNDFEIRKSLLKHIQKEIIKKLVQYENMKPGYSESQELSTNLGFSKYHLKHLSAIKNKTLIFIKKSKAMNSYLEETLGMALKRKFLKYMSILKKIKLILNKTPQPPSDKSHEDDLVKAFKKRVVKLLLPDKSIKMDLVKQMANKISSTDSSNAGHSQLKKVFLKMISLMKRLSLQQTKLMSPKHSLETETSDSMRLNKKVLKFIHNLKSLKLSFFNYFHPQVVILVENLESSKMVLRKRLFKFLNNEKIMKFVSNKESLSPEFLENKPNDDFSISKTLMKYLQTEITNSLVNNKFSSSLISHESESNTDKAFTISKTGFKNIPVSKPQIVSFVKNAQFYNALLNDILNPSLKKNLLKLILASQKISLKSAIDSLEALSLITKAKENESSERLHKMLLKYVPFFENIKQTVVKHLHEAVSSASAPDQKIKIFKKTLLKFVQALGKIGSTYNELSEAGFTDQKQSKDMVPLLKRLFKFVLNLKQLKMEFQKYIDPKVSHIVDNSNGSVQVIMKQLYKFISPEQPLKMSLYKGKLFNKAEENLVAASAFKIRKNFLKLVKKRDKPANMHMLKSISHSIALLKNEKTNLNSLGFRSKLFHQIASDFGSNLTFKKQITNSIAHIYSNNADASDSQFRSKLLKFFNSLKTFVLTFTKNSNMAMDKSNFTNNSNHVSVFRSKANKFINSQKKIISVFNKNNFLNLLKRKSEQAKISSLKSKAYKYLISQSSPALKKTSSFTALNNANKGQNKNMNTYRSQFLKAMFKEEMKSLTKTEEPMSKKLSSLVKKSISTFKSKLIKSIMTEHIQAMKKESQLNKLSWSNSSKNKVGAFKTTMLKSNLLQQVFVKYISSKMNSSMAKKVKRDSILKSIVFNTIMKDVKQKTEFLKFSLAYIKKHSLLPPTVSKLSQKIIFKQLESLYVEKQFLRYIQENHDPRLVEKIKKIKNLPSDRIKFNRLIKIFGDKKLRFDRLKKQQKPIQKIKSLIHDFKKAYIDLTGAGNKEGVDNVQLTFETFINRMVKLVNDPHELGKMATVGSHESEQIICCSCCSSGEGNCAESNSKSCDCSKSQAEINNDDTFVERVNKIINVDPIVNIHIRVRSKDGNFVERENFTLTTERDLSDTPILSSNKVTSALSSRLI